MVWVAGAEARQLLVSSGLPADILQHIWTLSDLTAAGQLTAEEFALCMKLVTLALQGVALPAVLPPSWVPPSLRARLGIPGGAAGAPTAAAAAPLPPPRVVATGDPEIDALAQSIAAQKAALADVQGKVGGFKVRDVTVRVTHGRS